MTTLEISLAKKAVKENTFSLLSVNVQSLNCNIYPLSQLIDELGKPKVICLSETWNASNYASNLKGYYLIDLQIRNHSRGGGVGIWLHHSINAARNNELKKLKLSAIEIAHCVIDFGPKKILLLSVYRPPGKQKAESLKDFKELLCVCNDIGLPMILTGDINIDLLKSNPMAVEYLDLIQSFQLEQQVKSATRISKKEKRTIQTLIDHVIVDATLKAKSYPINASVADHLPILTLLNPKTSIFKSTESSSKLMKIDFSSLQNELAKIDWKKWIDEHERDDADEAFSVFHSKITTLINKCSVARKNRRKNKSKTHWVSKETLDIKKEADKFRKKYLKNGALSHFERFKKLHKSYNSGLRKDKLMYFNKKLSEAGKNAKAVWGLINEATGRKSKNSENSEKVPELKINGKIEKKPEIICQEFNSFFKDVAFTKAKTIKTPNKSFEEYLKLTEQPEKKFEFQKITEDEMMQIISSLKNKNSAGFDRVSYRTLKKIAIFIIKPLTYCMNKCIEESKFPSILKKSKITPIFKKGDPNNPKNFRPISILSSFSQIFQKVLNKQTSEFIQENSIMYENQYGFLAKHSTFHALLASVNKIELAKNKKLYTILISLDFSMAFDTCDTKEVLPKKLRYYFKDEKSCTLLDSFFQGRKQYVKIGENESKVENSHDISVVQGATISGSMFSVYINDMAKIVDPDCEMIIFADDTNCLLSGRNIEELFKKANKNLEIIQDYCNANKLSLNIEKTKYAIFCPQGKKVDSNLSLQIENQTVEKTNEILFLGVTIDTKLQFRSHFLKVLEKVKKGVNAITTVKRTLSFQAKLKIYHSLIHSHFSYCSTIWLPKISKKELKQLSVLQKRALRALFGVRYNCHTGDLFDMSRIIKVEDLCDKEYLITMYKYKEKLLPSAIAKLIDDATTKHKQNTRLINQEMYYINNSLKEGNLLYDMIKMWNETNIEIKETSYSIPVVKKRLNHFFRLDYKNECNKINCHSCKNSYDEARLIKYMNY